MAYRGLGNQTLGGVADFSQVLDTITRLERESTRSKERVAMEHIREDLKTRRQSMRDDRAYTEQRERDVYTHNKDLLGQYPSSELDKDEEGFYYPRAESLTYEKRADKVSTVEDALGISGVKYGTPLYNAYRTSMQRGAAFYDEPSVGEYYKKTKTVDPSPGVLTAHDYDEAEAVIMEKARVDYVGQVGNDIDWEGFERGVQSGLASNKLILSADKYQDYLKNLQYTREQEGGEREENYKIERDHIRSAYVDPVYTSLWKETDIGPDYTDKYKQDKKTLLEALTKDKSVPSNLISQYEEALYDMFGDFNAPDNKILDNFIKWNKRGRSASDQSIAEEIYSHFGFQSQYKNLDRLTSSGKDIHGVVSDERLKNHFDMQSPQADKYDEWKDYYPTIIGILDQAVDEGAISLDTKNNQLQIKVDDKGRWFKWMDEMDMMSQEQIEKLDINGSPVMDATGQQVMEDNPRFNERVAEDWKRLLDQLGSDQLKIY